MTRIETIRLLIDLAASDGWETTFIHGAPKDVVYVCQPEGFENEGSKDRFINSTKRCIA